MRKPIIPAAKAEQRFELERVRLLDEMGYNDPRRDWREAILIRIRPHETVLDIGRSTRDWSSPSAPGRV